MAGHTVPGVSVAVSAGGNTTRVTSGFADVEKKQPVTTDTEFRLASITKNYLAVLALELVERNRLRLDDPVEKWLPDLPPHLEYVRKATVRQLLSHTSGTGQTFTRDEDRGRVLTLDDQFDRIPDPVCEPGTCYSYADGNYILIGLIIEAASGRTVAEELRKTVLEPLGLNETHVGRPDDPSIAVAKPYVLVYGPDDQPVKPHQLMDQLLPEASHPGARGIFASAGDLALFGAGLFEGRLIDESLLDLMLDTSLSKLPCPANCTFPYGLGLFRYEINGRRLVGHDGSSGTIYAFEPDTGITISILTNGGEQDIGAFLASVLEVVDGRDQSLPRD
jgi:D-alanyl-D-alanine carboxypeptidase